MYCHVYACVHHVQPPNRYQLQLEFPSYFFNDTMMAILSLDDSDTHEQELGDGQPVSSSQPGPSTTSITESLHNTATSATPSCSGQESNEEQPILSQPGPSTAESLHDIGTLAKPSASVEEISQKICSLSNGKKYTLLFQHAKPPTSFPATFTHGCRRRFSVSWLDKYAWLRYSPSLDGIFCGPCSVSLLLEVRKDKGLLVNRPFSTGSKLVMHSLSIQSICTTANLYRQPII